MKRWMIGLLIGFVFLAGFGVQQAWYQHQQTRVAATNQARDRCYAQWGRDVVEALDARSAGTQTSDVAAATAAKARVKKDDASDAIFLFVASAASHPSTDPAVVKARDVEAKRLLATFVVAKHALVASEKARVAAENARDNVRTANPFPKLKCSGQALQPFFAAVGALMAALDQLPSSVEPDRAGSVRP